MVTGANVGNVVGINIAVGPVTEIVAIFVVTTETGAADATNMGAAVPTDTGATTADAGATVAIATGMTVAVNAGAAVAADISAARAAARSALAATRSALAARSSAFQGGTSATTGRSSPAKVAGDARRDNPEQARIVKLKSFFIRGLLLGCFEGFKSRCCAFPRLRVACYRFVHALSTTSRKRAKEFCDLPRSAAKQARTRHFPE